MDPFQRPVVVIGVRPDPVPTSGKTYSELKIQQQRSHEVVIRLINGEFMAQLLHPAIARKYVSVLKGRHLDPSCINDEDVRRIQHLFSQQCPTVQIEDLIRKRSAWGVYSYRTGKISINAGIVDPLLEDHAPYTPSLQSALKHDVVFMLFSVFAHELAHFIRHCGCSNPPAPNLRIWPGTSPDQAHTVAVPYSYGTAKTLVRGPSGRCADYHHEAGLYIEQEICGGVIDMWGPLYGNGTKVEVYLLREEARFIIDLATARQALQTVPLVPLLR